MLHRPRAAATLLVALLLAAATPAATIQAADPSASLTPHEHEPHPQLRVRVDPGRRVAPRAGRSRVTCTPRRSAPGPGRIRPTARSITAASGTLPVARTPGWCASPSPSLASVSGGQFHFRARLQVNFGGIIGHKIRVTAQDHRHGSGRTEREAAGHGRQQQLQEGIHGDHPAGRDRSARGHRGADPQVRRRELPDGRRHGQAGRPQVLRVGRA